MMSAFDIYIQPQAFTDSYQLAKHAKRCKTSRDLYSAAYSPESKTASQLPSWIRGKMTAVQQVTDTDVGQPFKLLVTEEQNRLRRELRQAAESAGQGMPSFKCGYYEMIRVAYETFVQLKELQYSRGTLLAAARRNGWLSFRPSLSSGKMEDSSQQAWASGYPEGNHRMKHSWIEARKRLIDESGKLLPVYDEDPLENQCDHAPHGDEGAHISLASWTVGDEKKMVEEPEAVLECTAVADELGAEELAEELEPLKVRRERQMKVIVDPSLTVLQKAAQIREKWGKKAKMKLAVKEAIGKDLAMLRRCVCVPAPRQRFCKSAQLSSSRPRVGSLFSETPERESAAILARSVEQRSIQGSVAHFRRRGQRSDEQPSGRRKRSDDCRLRHSVGQLGCLALHQLSDGEDPRDARMELSDR